MSTTETSHEALALMESTGARRRHMATVWETLVEHPGLAASELAVLSGYDPVETRRRLTDLKKRDKAYQLGKSYVSGRPEMLWWPRLQQGALPL